MIIILNGTALLWISLNSELWTLIFWSGLLEVILIIELVRFIEKFKSNILVFLESINQGDYTLTFPKGNTKNSDGRFANLFNSIVRNFQSLRAEKETRHIFLNTVIEQVSVAIIGYDDNKNITLINNAAKELLDRPYIKNVSGIIKVSKQLHDEIIQVDGKDGVLIKYERQGELMQVLLRATEMKSNGEYLKIVTLQDIKNELDEKELESWQKLIRIINHEVMNSMIPLSTLTNVNKSVLQEIKAGRESGESLSIDEDRISDVIEGMEIIEGRSKGIMDFVKSVKSLTNISKPNFVPVRINDLLNRVYTLMNPEFTKTQVDLVLRLPTENFSTTGDLELLEHALINLIKNAREAFGEQKPSKVFKVVLSADRRDGFTTISVQDNGPGMSAEIRENIFVPFYTTKKGGSGIGLALSRQIMRLHKGQLICQSEEGKGTIFTLKF
jgi:nitrogen fixation/metabolism regulation signal transduction histidine kinase